MKINRKQYKTVIVYGIGQYYEKVKKDLFQCITPDYLCDRKWDVHVPDSYDGIPVIKREELYTLEQGLIIMTTGFPWVSASVKSDLENISGISVIHVDEVIGERKSITGKKLKEICREGYYQDAWENQIYFDRTIPDSLEIYFHGKQNILRFGKNVLVNKLVISFGNRGVCSLGDGTEVVDGYFVVSDASLTIGADCLLAAGVIVRTHDEHHIFDADTHERINYPKDVVIGDNVWIGLRASILAGARIGRGSVVGAGAVTSGQFGDHQIIAGCPAKVLRERVCWSRDNTYYFNHDTLEECVSQEAFRYSDPFICKKRNGEQQ